MLKKLPAAIQDALANGPVAGLLAARELANDDLRIAVLWILRNEGNDAEAGRVLAIECNRFPDSAVAQACRIWLMRHDNMDLGVVHTLLSFLHRELAEKGIWPNYLWGTIFEFVRDALGHPEPSVRTQVLSLLTVAVHRECLSKVLHAEGASSLADALENAVAAVSDLDEEEHEDLLLVVRTLNSNQSIAPALDPRALQRIVLELMDAVDRLAPLIDGLDSLVADVKERALLDDAGARAASEEKPLQTLRVIATEATTRLLQVMVSFAEAVVSTVRDPEFAESDTPDYGLRIAWAPAASVPIHLSYDDDDGRIVFETLEKILDRNGSDFESTAADVSPNVAAAFVRLLERLRQDDGEIEVILTDPQSPTWQRSLRIGPDSLGRDQVSSLMRRTRSAARGRTTIVAKEDVPQANSVRQVFEAVDAVLARGVVTHNDITDVSSQRQVNYYKQGARVLGFLDEDNQPTGRARLLVGRTYEERLAITAVYFEDSAIGRAWRAWTGANHLYEIDPHTAHAFLAECVRGLTGTTPARRASTLRAWFDELKTQYPQRSGGPWRNP